MSVALDLLALWCLSRIGRFTCGGRAWHSYSIDNPSNSRSRSSACSSSVSVVANTAAEGPSYTNHATRECPPNCAAACASSVAIIVTRP